MPSPAYVLGIGIGIGVGLAPKAGIGIETETQRVVARVPAFAPFAIPSNHGAAF